MTPPATSSPSATIRTAYDSLSRLKSATAKTPGHEGNAQQFSYDRYGSILTVTTAPSLITGLDDESMKFTGHERDSAGPGAEGMDLDYMHARFYDPTQGRFLSVDPTWKSADLVKPQSWNRYSYVLNNP